MPSSVVLSTEKNLRHRRRINTEEKEKVVPAAWGMELIQFLSALANLHQDDLKKRMNKIMATWRNGCFEKMEDNPFHTTPNQHLRTLLLGKLHV